MSCHTLMHNISNTFLIEYPLTKLLTRWQAPKNTENFLNYYWKLIQHLCETKNVELKKIAGVVFSLPGSFMSRLCFKFLVSCAFYLQNFRDPCFENRVWDASGCKSPNLLLSSIHKKKVLDSRKFSTSALRWIHMFWDGLNTISPFLENVCLY